MKRLILTAAVFTILAMPASGQQDSLLQNAIRLATEGQADSARALTAAWIARLTPSDSAYPEALYAAGVVAGDTERALTYLRRVSIEYARSEWADDALLRMSQIAFAEGQLRPGDQFAGHHGLLWLWSFGQPRLAPPGAEIRSDSQRGQGRRRVCCRSVT